MKAEELRIGNLCYYHVEDSIEGDHDVLNTVDYEDLRIMFGEVDEDYKPIPLTEEWLLKFGFVHRKRRDVPAYEKNNLIVEYLFERWTGRLYWNERNSIRIIDVEYVHQLQNLYFALTGEELTIKSNNK